MIGAIRAFSSLLRDRQGNVLPLAAVGMIITAALVGGGIDMARGYRAQNRLQSACDAGVLAGRRFVTSTGTAFAGSDAEAKARTYFAANFDDGSLETENTVFTPTSIDNGQTVTGTATTELKLIVMKIFGFPRFSLSADCQASMGMGNSDVVMVLDTTGSMAGSRISALQTAMKNFYTTVSTATAGSNARIRYGFVPYSVTVNVGALLDPDYLVSSYGYQSRVMGNPSVTYSGSSTANTALYGSNNYGSSSSCQSALPASTAWSNNGASSTSSTTNSQTVTQPETRRVYDCAGPYSGRYYPYSYDEYRTSTTTKTFVYQKVTYDVSRFKAFETVSTNTGSGGSAVSSTWDGCIEERDTVATGSVSFSTGGGMSPSNAHDLNIDLEPNSDQTRWRPRWPEVAYLRNGNKPGYYDTCPKAAQLLTTMSQSDFNSYANSLTTDGNTYHDIGLIWGARIISPEGIFKSNVNVAPSNGGEVARHLIFMSDGDMDTNPINLSAWGIESLDLRVTGNGSESREESWHSTRFLAICAAIKAKGIRLWTIFFDNGTNSDMTTCASANSAYNANNPAQLNTAFQDIAKQVGELRIIR